MFKKVGFFSSSPDFLQPTVSLINFSFPTGKTSKKDKTFESGFCWDEESTKKKDVVFIFKNVRYSWNLDFKFKERKRQFQASKHLSFIIDNLGKKLYQYSPGWGLFPPSIKLAPASETRRFICVKL